MTQIGSSPDIIRVKHSQGGMSEFERSGIYPQSLYFYSPKHKKSWLYKVKVRRQEGFLKNAGKILYKYLFVEDRVCKVCDENGTPVKVEMVVELCD